MKCGGEGRGGGRCLIEGGSYFNFICFGGGLIRSGSLLERGIQIKEIVYTKHLGGRNGCVWEEVGRGSNIILWTVVRYYF